VPTDVSAPLTVTFSKLVTEISSSTVTVGIVPAGSPTSTPVVLSLACVAGSAAAVACDPAAAYSQLRITPAGTWVPGQHYQLVLNPVGVAPAISDLAGNALALVTKAFRGPQAVQETSAASVPGWRSVSVSSASGGSYAVSHTAGSSASFSFTGTAVTWQTVTGPTQGLASVYVDGVLKLSVNNYAAALHYGVLRTVSGLAAGPHVLKIVVKGTKGATAGTDTQVGIDSFLVAAVRSQQSSATYTWKRVATSAANGGGYAVDDLAGASYSMTFRGTSVVWWTVYGPAMGKASVYVDGVLKGTFSNYAASLAYGKARSVTGLTDAPHTIRIVVLGSHATGATGNSVVVDRLTVG
jgi:bacillopeptidase F